MRINTKVLDRVTVMARDFDTKMMTDIRDGANIRAKHLERGIGSDVKGYAAFLALAKACDAILKLQIED